MPKEVMVMREYNKEELENVTVAQLFDALKREMLCSDREFKESFLEFLEQDIFRLALKIIAPDRDKEVKVFKLAQEEKTLADGCLLPDGQAAIAWCGEHKTHGCYPSMSSFLEVQRKIPGRAIDDSASSKCFGIQIIPRTFKLVRTEDVTGVSGTGVVAVGCEFPEVCVLQWLGGSTFWYPSLEIVRALHGHQGKMEIVF